MSSVTTDGSSILKSRGAETLGIGEGNEIGVEDLADTTDGERKRGISGRKKPAKHDGCDECSGVRVAGVQKLNDSHK